MCKHKVGKQSIQGRISGRYDPIIELNIEISLRKTGDFSALPKELFVVYGNERRESICTTVCVDAIVEALCDVEMDRICAS